MSQKIWWGQWPGALGLGLASALLASAGFITGLFGLLVPDTRNVGTDRQAPEIPWWLLPLSLTLVAAAVALPVLTTLWARRRWAGFVLLGLGLSSVVGFVGLVQVGIF